MGQHVAVIGHGDGRRDGVSGVGLCPDAFDIIVRKGHRFDIKGHNNRFFRFVAADKLDGDSRFDRVCRHVSVGVVGVDIFEVGILVELNAIDTHRRFGLDGRSGVGLIVNAFNVKLIVYTVRSDREAHIEGGGFANVSRTVFVTVVHGNGIEVIAGRQTADRNNRKGFVGSGAVFGRGIDIACLFVDGEFAAGHADAGNRRLGVSAVGDGNGLRRGHGIFALGI